MKNRMFNLTVVMSLLLSVGTVFTTRIKVFNMLPSATSGFVGVSSNGFTNNIAHEVILAFDYYHENAFVSDYSGHVLQAITYQVKQSENPKWADMDGGWKKILDHFEGILLDSNFILDRNVTQEEAQKVAGIALDRIKEDSIYEGPTASSYQDKLTGLMGIAEGRAVKMVTAKDKFSGNFVGDKDGIVVLLPYWSLNKTTGKYGVEYNGVYFRYCDLKEIFTAQFGGSVGIGCPTVG